MSIERFKTLDEARKATWLKAGDPRIAARIAWAWSWSARLPRTGGQRGVRCFRTHAEANADRDRAMREAIIAMRESRPKGIP